MAQGPITTAVRRLGPDAAALDIGGDVTGSSDTDLQKAFGEASDSGVRAIILNFSDLEYMNSGGIGLLVTLLVRANRQGQRLLACGLNEHYRQIFSLTRLDEAIALHDTEEAALSAVEGTTSIG